MLKIQTEIDNLIINLGQMIHSGAIDRTLAQTAIDTVFAIRWTHQNEAKKLLEVFVNTKHVSF